MDCQTAIEYINLHVDGMLGDADTERLFEHIRTCEHCRKEFDKTLMLKKALSNLDELEPPAGLALSAIKKAKKRRVPVFAYASAAVAAAIALVAVFSPSIFPKSHEDSTGSVLYDKSYAQQEVAPEAAEAPQMEAHMSAATNVPGEGGDSVMMGASAPEESAAQRDESATNGVVSITVPAGSWTDFRGSLDAFIEKYEVSPERADDDAVLFTIPEGGLSELQTLIASVNVAYNGAGGLAAGSRIEFIPEE